MSAKERLARIVANINARGPMTEPDALYDNRDVEARVRGSHGLTGRLVILDEIPAEEAARIMLDSNPERHDS